MKERDIRRTLNYTFIEQEQLFKVDYEGVIGVFDTFIQTLKKVWYYYNKLILEVLVFSRHSLVNDILNYT